MFRFWDLRRIRTRICTPLFIFRVLRRFRSRMGLMIQCINRCWKLNHLSGCRIVLLQFVGSVLLRSQLLLVENIIVVFVVGFFAEHVLKDGVCCRLSLGRGIRRGFVMPAMTGLILVEEFLLIPLAMLCKCRNWTCMRGWLNLLVGLSMELLAGIQDESLEVHTPSSSERNQRLGNLNSCQSWCSSCLQTWHWFSHRSEIRSIMVCPIAICSIGSGWGAQIGGELMDYIIVLHDFKAVKTFCSRMHFSLGTGCSAAAGPVGRVLEADIRAGDRGSGSGMCYTYSCSKGAFVGVSLEGNVVATRMDTNLKFYGDPYLTTADIFLGTVDAPKAAEL